MHWLGPRTVAKTDQRTVRGLVSVLAGLSTLLNIPRQRRTIPTVVLKPVLAGISDIYLVYA